MTAVFNATVAVDQLIVGDHVQTNNTLVTTAVARARGDLLIIGAGNVATHATDPAVWDAIAVEGMTAAQATYHAANGIEAAVYTQGEFDVALCKISGVVLTGGQYAAARARGAKLNIELRKVGA
jgi:hypothetical protein